MESDSYSIKEFIDWLWVVAGAAFAYLNSQVNKLRENVANHDKAIELNNQRDEMQYTNILDALNRIEDKIKQYDKNINNFYSQNPNIKRPEE